MPKNKGTVLGGDTVSPPADMELHDATPPTYKELGIDKMHEQIPARKIISNLEQVMDRLEDEHGRLTELVNRGQGERGSVIRLCEIEHGFEVVEALQLWLLASDAPF